MLARATAMAFCPASGKSRLSASSEILGINPANSVLWVSAVKWDFHLVTKTYQKSPWCAVSQLGRLPGKPRHREGLGTCFSTCEQGQGVSTELGPGSRKCSLTWCHLHCQKHWTPTRITRHVQLKLTLLVSRSVPNFWRQFSEILLLQPVRVGKRSAWKDLTDRGMRISKASAINRHWGLWDEVTQVWIPSKT